MIHTIGHSNHPIDVFIRLLQNAGISALADVRSAPWSRHWPQYRKRNLQSALQEAGIAYVWLGDALGGKPKDQTLWRYGRPDHALIAASPEFSAAIDRLVAGMAQYRIAIMCAEKDPLNCHRTHLVTPALIARNIQIGHILSDGSVITHDALTPLDRNKTPDLFV